MRFGIIGCGWAGMLRAEAIARIPDFHLVAVADQDTSRARTLAAARGAAVSEDWQALVRRDDLDAVIVATPPSQHPEMCIAACEHGKHALCEKPLARNPAECRQIVEAAQRARRHLATGFNYRFYPAVETLRQVLHSGQLGELDHIRSYAGHPGGSEFTHAWVHDATVMGGGTLLDNGIHILDLTLHFLGQVAEVKGYRASNVWHFEGCEDNGFALLKSVAGKIAVVQASWSEWRGYRFWIEIFGTRGCVRASYPPMFAQATWQENPQGRTSRRWYLYPGFQISERLRSPRWTAVQSFVKELSAFARAVRGEKTVAATGLDGLRAVEIAHAVYESSETGRSVIVTVSPAA